MTSTREAPTSTGSAGSQTPAQVLHLRRGKVREGFIVADDLPPLLKAGTYEAAIVGYEIYPAKIFGNAVKLRLDFDVFESSGKPAVRLHGHYNVDRIDSNGRPVFRAQSKFARDWRTVTRRRPIRRDRMPPSALMGVLVTVSIRTTFTDRNQRRLSEANYYSVVDRIEDVLAGGHQHR